ncbi:MAG: hypothetical protein P4K86_05415 [Terracidiphilus sp.]|nr:hypothetical protein [Terracidiphilus sp.]
MITANPEISLHQYLLSIQRREDLTEGILGQGSDFLGRLSTSWAGRPILALFG